MLNPCFLTVDGCWELNSTVNTFQTNNTAVSLIFKQAVRILIVCSYEGGIGGIFCTLQPARSH